MVAQNRSTPHNKPVLDTAIDALTSGRFSSQLALFAESIRSLGANPQSIADAVRALDPADRQLIVEQLDLINAFSARVPEVYSTVDLLVRRSQRASLRDLIVNSVENDRQSTLVREPVPIKSDQLVYTHFIQRCRQAVLHAVRVRLRST